MCNEKCENSFKKRVLVVDDDADFVEFCKTILEREGYEIVTAYNGEEGRDQVNSKKPDLILLDMMMETWSEGINMVECLRSSAETKRIPIILISSVNFRSPMSEEAPEDSLDVDAYLVKPIKPDKLLEQVKRALTT